MKQETEDIGLQGQDIVRVCYKTTHIGYKREGSLERFTEVTSRIQVAKIHTEGEEKKRADEIKIQMAKIEADKELTLKEMELEAQDQAQCCSCSTSS